MTGTVEKIYSAAVFELACEQNCADAVKDELDAVAVLFADNPGFGKVLSVPTVAIGEKLDILKKTFKDRVSELTYNLLCVVTEKGRAYAVPAIAEDYKNRWYEMKNIAEVKVTTSVPLSGDLRDKLKAKLEKVYRKSVIITENVDPSIMGGMIINYGNTMIDGSVKTKLDAIQKQVKGIIA